MKAVHSINDNAFWFLNTRFFAFRYAFELMDESDLIHAAMDLSHIFF